MPANVMERINVAAGCWQELYFFDTIVALFAGKFFLAQTVAGFDAAGAKGGVPGFERARSGIYGWQVDYLIRDP